MEKMVLDNPLLIDKIWENQNGSDNFEHYKSQNEQHNDGCVGQVN